MVDPALALEADVVEAPLGAVVAAPGAAPFAVAAELGLEDDDDAAPPGGIVADGAVRCDDELDAARCAAVGCAIPR